MNYKAEFVKATKVLIAISIVSCLIEFIFNPDFQLSDVKEWLLTNLLFTYPFYFANGFLVNYLDEWMPWKDNAKRRAIYGTIITVIVNLIVIYIVITVVAVVVHGGSPNYVFTPRGKNTVLITFVIVTVITLIFYSIGFFHEVQNQRLLNETLRKEKVSAELNALKAQVDPHFLFNSFNVLSGLIDENPKQAQKFLGGLSRIYRYILENRNEDVVTLKSELDFAKEYLNLQEVRFEDSINLVLDIENESLAKKLPALSLQLVLENAIKHNGFDVDNPLNISITDGGDHIVVKNNKKNRTRLHESNGMGLENITKRYDLRKVSGFKIEDGHESFAVHLPLIDSVV